MSDVEVAVVDKKETCHFASPRRTNCCFEFVDDAKTWEGEAIHQKFQLAYMVNYEMRVLVW